MELSQNGKFIQSVFNKALIPCILAMLSTNINVIVDGVLLGNLIGQNALAAINLSLPYYLFLCIIGSFFGYGSSTEASLALGANNKELAISYFRTGITFLLISSIICTGLSLIFLDPIVDLLCSEQTIRSFVREYVLITAIGILPKIMIYIPYGYLRLDGRNVEVMLMMGIMAAANIILDVFFVAGLGLGVFGAGLASVIATLTVCLLGFFWLFNKKKSTFIPGLGIIKNRYLINKMLSSGGPFALNNSFSTIRIIIINYFLLKMGGGLLVAMYSAINGIANFAEGITLGVPQAGSAILGVCKGEGDTESMIILFKRMIKTGFSMLAVYGILIVVFYDPIAKAYAIDASLFFPLLMLAISLFPTLFFNVLQNYYNIVEKDFFADFIIFIRLFAMIWGSLWLCSTFNFSPWIFLVVSELGSLIIWAVICIITKKCGRKESTFLYNPDPDLTEGQSLNFSVADTSEDICNASERIGDFCSETGMSVKQTMRLSMSIEEILQLVKNENPETSLYFDLRAFYTGHSIILRFRYEGKDFNPFNIPEDDPDDKYMGIMMIQNLVSKVTHYRTFGTNTVQVILDDR